MATKQNSNAKSSVVNGNGNSSAATGLTAEQFIAQARELTKQQAEKLAALQLQNSDIADTGNNFDINDISTYSANQKALLSTILMYSSHSEILSELKKNRKLQQNLLVAFTMFSRYVFLDVLDKRKVNSLKEKAIIALSAIMPKAKKCMSYLLEKTKTKISNNHIQLIEGADIAQARNEFLALDLSVENTQRFLKAVESTTKSSKDNNNKYTKMRKSLSTLLKGEIDDNNELSIAYKKLDLLLRQAELAEETKLVERQELQLSRTEVIEAEAEAEAIAPAAPAAPAAQQEETTAPVKVRKKTGNKKSKTSDKDQEIF